MTKRIVLICLLLIFSLVLLSACNANSQPPPTAVPPLVQIGPGKTYANNLTIRIDTVTILENDGDSGLGSEPFFAILVLRNHQANVRSAKLLLPGQGTFTDVAVGDIINLADFSIQLNGLSENETITLYLLGFESDEVTTGFSTADSALDALLGLLVDTALDTVLPASNLAELAISSLTGPALEWWQANDTLGEYQLSFSPQNNNIIGKQTQAITANGNLNFTFTVLHSTELVETPSGSDHDQFVLTLINRSSQPITRVFIAPTGKSIFEHESVVMILPNHVQGFAVQPGLYNLRAETAAGFYWEKAEVRIETQQSWFVSN